jgi:hypothetical protein
MQHGSEFEAAEPAIAANAWRLFRIPGFGLGYLATIRKDGGPRIHPVNVEIADGRLVTFIGRSPKLDDLRRDGRFALHAPGSEEESDEAAITGRAIERNDDAAFRAAAVEAMPYAVAADSVCFELALETALWAEYTKPPT